MPDRFSDLATRRLAVVGTGPAELLQAIGSLADDGSPNLVGSLASDLGNAGSDIDVHILVESDATGNTPVMFFHDKTVVDVQYFERKGVRDTVSGVSGRVVPISAGYVAIGAAPDKKTSVRLSRWLDATPLLKDGIPLLDEADRVTIEPVLARRLLESAIVSAFLATCAVTGSSQRAQWRRASVAVLSLAVHFLGETYMGTKWIWKKAARSGIGSSLIDDVSTASTSEHWEKAWAAAQLPPAEPGDFVALAASGAGETYELGDRRLTLAGDVLVDERATQDPTLLAPDQLADLLQRQAMVPQIDHDRLDAWLYEVAVAG